MLGFITIIGFIVVMLMVALVMMVIFGAMSILPIIVEGLITYLAVKWLFRVFRERG